MVVQVFDEKNTYPRGGRMEVMAAGEVMSFLKLHPE